MNHDVAEKSLARCWARKYGSEPENRFAAHGHEILSVPGIHATHHQRYVAWTVPQ